MAGVQSLCSVEGFVRFLSPGFHVDGMTPTNNVCRRVCICTNKGLEHVTGNMLKHECAHKPLGATFMLSCSATHHMHCVYLAGITINAFPSSLNICKGKFLNILTMTLLTFMFYIGK